MTWCVNGQHETVLEITQEILEADSTSGGKFWTLARATCTTHGCTASAALRGWGKKTGDEFVLGANGQLGSVAYLDGLNARDSKLAKGYRYLERNVLLSDPSYRYKRAVVCFESNTDEFAHLTGSTPPTVPDPPTSLQQAKDAQGKPMSQPSLAIDPSTPVDVQAGQLVGLVAIAKPEDLADLFAHRARLVDEAKTARAALDSAEADLELARINLLNKI